MIKNLTSLCFYLLPFLFAINFAFDTSKTIDKRYYAISKKEIVRTDNSSEGFDVHNYYLDLVPKNKNVDPPKWVEVSEKTDNTFRGVFSSKFVSWNGKPYRIFAKKKVTDAIKEDIMHFFCKEHACDIISCCKKT